MTVKDALRHWKACLLPLLTCLTAAVLALLPPRLSEWEDARRAGAVQCEALPADSNFPSAPPDLPGRIRLLAQWRQSPGEVTIVQQLLEEPEALEEAAAMMRSALKALTEAGVLPAGQPEFGAEFTASRLYLRDRADLSSAGFLNIWTRDQTDYTLSMLLDLETGRALSFQLTGPAVFLELDRIPPETVGTRFLNYLRDDTEDSTGISWRTVPEDTHWTKSGFYNSVDFYLSSCQCRYSVLVLPELMRFMPELDQETETQMSAASTGQSAK